MEVEQSEINLGFDYCIAPLMRVHFLRSGTENGESEIILTFHHSITDAASLI